MFFLTVSGISRNLVSRNPWVSLFAPGSYSCLFTALRNFLGILSRNALEAPYLPFGICIICKLAFHGTVILFL